MFVAAAIILDAQEPVLQQRSAFESTPGNLNIIKAFARVGEYAEARRIDEELNHWVDAAEGRYDKVSEGTQRFARDHPNVEGAAIRAAEALYQAGRIDEALPFFERAYEFVRDGRPFYEPRSLHKTVRFAVARRQVGDEEGARTAASIARRDLAARRAAGRQHQALEQSEALLAAFDQDADRLFMALSSAMEQGMRDRGFFDDPAFRDYRDHPRMVTLRQELDAVIEAEHEAVLHLICADNPVPGEWQPLAETCKRLINGAQDPKP